MIVSNFRWHVAVPAAVDAECEALAVELGISRRLLALLAVRGITSAGELRRFLAPAEDGLHDPRLLPDAEATLRRVAQARAHDERVMVYGDFDADGLTGLSILVLALRSLGLDVEPYVPERLGDGHGLSLRAIDRAVAEGRTLIVTADCGTSSPDEIELARDRGIDVLVTDHHHAASWPAAAVAVVNPMREDSVYPDRQLTGAGVAWKVAHLLIDELEGEGSGGTSSAAAAPSVAATSAAGRRRLPQAVRDLADLALIGTVADVAPILGENRSIAQLGLEALRAGKRLGLTALLERGGVALERLDLDDIGFAIAPRLNAAGRMGEAGRAARLLLATDPVAAAELAAEIETANLSRRALTKVAISEALVGLGLGLGAGLEAVSIEVGEVAEVAVSIVSGAADATDAADSAVAGAVLAAEDLPAALLVRGEWPVGIIGLIAGRLAEDFGRPAVIATTLDAEAGTLRASCRSGGRLNLAEALIACDDLLIRHGGHEAAAGFDIHADRWPDFAARFLGIAAAQARPQGPPVLAVDLVLPADSVDYTLVREIALLAPTGAGNPAPLLAITGFKVTRVRAASGGHTQLVLRRTKDVIDGVAFRRPDLATMLREGDLIDVVARPASRKFGGFESMQLEILDVGAAGEQLGRQGRPSVG